MYTDTNIQLAGMIGGQEILVILLIVLIFFGGKKIPDLMKGLGKGMREYKKAVSGIEEEFSGTGEDSKKHSEKHSENSESTAKDDSSQKINETENS